MTHLQQGMSMAVVGLQILKKTGPNTGILTRCGKQDPPLYKVGKDTDVSVAFPDGHLIDTHTGDIREVGFLAGGFNMAL